MSAIAPSRISPWWARTVAVLISGFTALLAGEVLFRMIGAPEVGPIRRGRLQLSANPRLVFEPVPGFTASTTSDFEEYLGGGNRLGYRDQDHALEKKAGTLRVVVLGDSIAAGYGVERFEEMFPAILGERLRGAGLSVEILNFGVTGYNTGQEIETLRARALAFAPDIVLVAYCHNDREPPDPRLLEALREAHRKSPAVPATHAQHLLVKSALYRFLRYSAFAPKGAGWLGPGTTGAGDTVEASLRELAGLARENRFEVLLAVFPVLPKIYDPAYAEAHDQLERWAAELSFTHLDLRPAFRACRAAGARRLGLDLFHPSPVGHRCTGEAIAAEVERMVREP